MSEFEKLPRLHEFVAYRRTVEWYVLADRLIQYAHSYFAIFHYIILGSSTTDS